MNSGETGGMITMETVVMSDWGKLTHFRHRQIIRRPEELQSFNEGDLSSTNLNGAVVLALGQLRDRGAELKYRSRGGALTTGYVVLFTDGQDRVGQTSDEATRRESRTSVKDLLFGLFGA